MAIAKKKKKFYDVDMPILKKETQLYSYTTDELKGRYIKYDLTRLLRGKNAILQLKVDIKDNKLTSDPTEFIILPTFLRKMVRKGTSYVEDSFVTQCKDAQITIKPFLIARRKVPRLIRRALREKAREELIEYVKDKTSETIFKDILKNQIQKPLSLKLKKIYPLSLCEIRVLKIEKKQEKKQEKKPKEKEEKVKEKEDKKETPKKEKVKAEVKEEQIEEEPKEDKKE